MLHQTMALLQLDEKDRLLYQMAIELGAQPASVLSKKTGLKRGDAYNHLNKMVEIGLMTKFNQKAIQYFDVADLSAVRFLVNEKRRHLDEADREIRRAQEQIDTIKSGPAWAKVRFYEGTQGVLELMERTVTQNKSRFLRSLTSMDHFYEVMSPEYDLNHYIPTRIQNEIFLRKLVRNSPSMRRMQKQDNKELREIRYLPDEVDFTGTMMTYDDEVLLFGVSRPIFGILVESPELADFLKKIFDMLWVSARREP